MDIQEFVDFWKAREVTSLYLGIFLDSFFNLPIFDMVCQFLFL